MIEKSLLISALLLVSLSTSVVAEEQSAPAEAPAEQTIETAEEQVLRFDIWEFHVLNNTVLDNALVEKAVTKHLGPDKTVEDVDAAANSLQNAYKNWGYPTVLVNVPQQKVDTGIVTLEVIEGKIGRLKVSGSRYFSLDEIKAMVPSLGRDVVPHLPTVQQQLRDVNTSSPDLRVTPIFRPGRLPGTVAVELRVRDDSPFHGSIEVNNKHTSSTTSTRLIGNLTYSNLWLKNHTASVTYQTSPEDTKEVSVIVASYSIPVLGDEAGDRLSMYAVSSDSETGVASSGVVSVVGNGNILGARWVKPMQGHDTYFHSIVYGVDYKDFDEVIGLEDTDPIVTPISYTIFSIDYNATSLAKMSTTTFKLGIRMSPRALFGNETVEFNNKRFEANPNFSVISAELGTEHRLLNGMEIAWRFAGQLANQPLISNEQFSVGGANTVRGYYESQVLADDAIRGTLEFRSPDLPWFTKKGFKDAYAMFFLDGATTKINKPLPDAIPRSSIHSAGIGFRVETQKSFNLELDVATPLKNNGIVEKEDIRVHFLLRGAF